LLGDQAAIGEGGSNSQVDRPNLSHDSRGRSSLSEGGGAGWPQRAVVQDHAAFTSPTTHRHSLVTDATRSRSDHNDDSHLGSSQQRQQQQSVRLQNSGESLAQ